MSKLERHTLEVSRLNDDFHKDSGLRDQIEKTLPLHGDRLKSSRLVPILKEGDFKTRGIQSSKVKEQGNTSVMDHKINIKKKLAGKDSITHK